MDEKKVQEQLNKRKEQAKKILSDAAEAEKFIKNVESKFENTVKSKKTVLFAKHIAQLKEYIPLSVSLVKSCVRGEYKEIPVGTIVVVVAALLYFFSPIDIIPDVIPGFGMIDDATLIGIVLLSIKSDLDDYKKWKAVNDNIIDIEPN